MKLRFFSLRFALIGFLAAAPLPATAAGLFTGLYAFGDSLTDTGNTNLATAGALPGAAFHSGRYSNGPVWLESLAGHLGLAGPTPSLTGGRDHAWAGAYTLSGGSVPSISQQAANFVGKGGTFLPTDLVVLWGGANDFLLGGQTNPAIPAGNLAGIISTLAGAGAKTILLTNLPDLGDTPELLFTGSAAAIAGFSQLSAGFNFSLYSQITPLETSLGINIIELDVFGIGKELKTNPAFGFTNTTQSALLTGNAANAGQYLYWDTVHPTSRVHDIFALRG
jgi:outer membrane lipase/esterase